MISNKKINAYYNAIRYCYLYYNRTGNRRYLRKTYALSNRLHRLEKQYWDNFNLATVEDEIKYSRLPESDYTIDVYYHDLIIHSQFLPAIDRVRVNKLVRSKFVVSGKYPIEVGGYDKHTIPDTTTSFPKIAYNTSTNYFNTQLAEVKESKPRQAKKRYRTIVRRKTRHGKTLKKRYRIDHKDLMLLSVYKPKSRAVVRKKDITYLQVDRFRKVTDYLESITLDFLYNEKIKTIVTCKLCGVKNSLLSYENSLGCRKCSRVGYNVNQYRIRYYYFSNYVRYELNELTGKVKKQIETNNGYKTIFAGKITK